MDSKLLSNEQQIEYEKLLKNGEPKKVKEYLYSVVSDDVKVYKYFRGTKRDYDTIFAAKAWAGNAFQQNDPFDSLAIPNEHSKVKYNHEDSADVDLAIKEYSKQQETYKEAVERQQTVLLSAFSEERDNILLWSHYANNHYGVCIEYSLKQLLQNNFVFPVVYRDKYSTTMNNLENALTKSSVWSYEKEWRLIIFADENKNGILIENIVPSSIICGARCGLVHFEDISKDNANGSTTDIHITHRPNLSDWLLNRIDNNVDIIINRYMSEMALGGEYNIIIKKILNLY